jgi:hypothetical protein
MTIAEVIGLLLAIAKELPAVDRWLQAAFLAYRDFRFKQDQAKASLDLKAAQAGSTIELQKDLSKLI